MFAPVLVVQSSMFKVKGISEKACAVMYIEQLASLGQGESMQRDRSQCYPEAQPKNLAF
jgi:hypothetical protein